jgi:hypothetical protein
MDFPKEIIMEYRFAIVIVSEMPENESSWHDLFLPNELTSTMWQDAPNISGSMLNNRSMSGGDGNACLLPLPTVCMHGNQVTPYRAPYIALNPHFGSEH